MNEKIQLIADHCLNYRSSSPWRAWFQIITTIFPFIISCLAMYISLSYSYWLTLALAFPTAGLVVRLFIIQHDCGHGSFFSSKWANDLLGRILSAVTLTPYHYWRRLHALHHASSSNLDKRGYGDIDTLTVREYLALPLHKKIGYRIYRNPFFLLFIGGPIHFAILQRWPFAFEKPTVKIWMSVLMLDAVLFLIYGSLIWYLGWQSVLLLAAPVAVIAASMGTWLFYIQHQFEDTHWAQSSDWDRKTSALYGSSYYVLPKILRWFTGNIGIHHVHHLCSNIPNYRLQECLDALPELKEINMLTIRESLKYAHLSLWDEDKKKLVSFASARG